MGNIGKNLRLLEVRPEASASRKVPAPNQTSVSVRAQVPQVLKDRLDSYAQSHGCSPSEILREALSSYLDKVA